MKKRAARYPTGLIDLMQLCTRAIIEKLEDRRLLSSSFTVTDLGVANFTSASAYHPLQLMAINNQGQVLVPGANGFLYSDGKTTPLVFLSPKFQKAYALALNDLGQIVGTFSGPRMGTQSYGGSFFGLGAGKSSFHLPDAFLYDDKRFIDIGPGSATSITASGNTAGISIRWNGSRGTWSANGAFVYVAGHRHALKLPPHSPAKDIVAVAIDNAGDVIVASDHLYLYSTHSRKPVQLSGMQFSSATMNAAGEVAGIVSNIDNPGTGPAPHAFTVTQAGTIDLGPINVLPQYAPLVFGINNSGEVVGDVQIAATNLSGAVTVSHPLPDHNSYAFVSRNGAIVDLNTLAPPAETGWTLQAAEGVNDAGQIVAIGADANGVQHDLLLTPTVGTV
ncbi:MAG TPA: hypothetical protein VFW23_09395 [Tepidisphaeraceae bacterium]|nr:hypothetical protein [Tepidisphaeraceae bacterium]